MANKFFAMLPKLKQDAAVNPDRGTVWEDCSYDFLNQLVKSLAVGGDIKDTKHIDSIPDIWARPLLFQMALFDKKNDAAGEFVKGLHDRVLGEWRAILAMLALNDIRHLGLKVTPVDLINDNSPLATILRELSPTESISGRENAWSTIYVIKYKNTPIAMTSPTMLVVSSADYMTSLAGELQTPWSTDGTLLCDPVDNLTNEELGALAFWLNQVYKSLQTIVSAQDSESGQLLLSVLDNYLSDVMSRQTARNLAVNNYTYANVNFGMNVDIFRLLDRCIRDKEATADDSAVRLMASGDRKPAHDVLLLSPNMVREFAQQENVTAAQLVIWPGLSANDIDENSLTADKTKIGNTFLTGQVEYRCPEDFFTERLVLVEPGDAVPAALSYQGDTMLAGDGTTAILPIKAELLQYLNATDISRRIRIENNGDKYTVVFNFPLSGMNGVQVDYKFVKEYPTDKVIFLMGQMPLLEVWPNFKRANWEKYYVFYENTQAQESQTELAKDVLYTEPWSYDGRMAVPNDGLINRYTAQIKGFPEAICCKIMDPDENNLYGTMLDAGLLLLKQPNTVNEQPELRWQMAIDFGTSGTMTYYCDGNTNPQPMLFESHLYQVFNSANSAIVDRSFFSFIPPESHEGSFLSIFHLLNPHKLNEDLQVLEDGHVFWHNTQRENSLKGASLNIDANLKWKDDAIGRRKVNAYINQVCLQSLVEAAAKGVESLSWNFSFPTAFSREQLSAFEVTCREAVQQAYVNSGYQDQNTDNIVEQWPESKAAAYHFNKLGNSDTNFSDGAICLDIGAGTTDISMVSGQPGRIVYHTSVQFAGRYLFSSLYDNYSLFAREDLEDNLSNGMKSEIALAMIDQDMKEHSEKYLHDLKNISGQENIKKMLQGAQFAVAGLFYYLGNILKELHAKRIYAEDHVPDIFVGGNGSRILHWITAGNFSSDNPFLIVLKDIITNTAGLAKNYEFEIIISDQPKIEVASGMVERRPNNDAEFYNEQQQLTALFGAEATELQANAVFAGDNYTVGGESRAENTFITAADINKGINVADLPELADFVEQFNSNRHIWSDGIEISERQKREIQKRVNSYYVSEKGKDVKKIFNEPIFIQGLKKTIEVITNE